MIGLTERNRTLGELMAELRARLGFVVQGNAATTNSTVIKSFLQEAHEFAFSELEPPAMRKTATIVLAAGSHLYDWHNDAEDEPIDPARVLSVWVADAGGDLRHPLAQGITVGDRRSGAAPSRPTRYDHLNGQIELYPVPDANYDLIVEYTATRARFDQPSDRPSVDDRLVLLYALATAKAHYRQPDAQAAAAAFRAMLAKEKFRQKEGKRFFAQAHPAAPGPQVVRRPDGTFSLG